MLTTDHHETKRARVVSATEQLGAIIDRAMLDAGATRLDQPAGHDLDPAETLDSLTALTWKPHWLDDAQPMETARRTLAEWFATGALSDETIAMFTDDDLKWRPDDPPFWGTTADTIIAAVLDQFGAVYAPPTGATRSAPEMVRDVLAHHRVLGAEWITASQAYADRFGDSRCEAAWAAHDEFMTHHRTDPA